MIQLRELSTKDSHEVFEMIKEIGPGENGFGNSGYNMSYEVFPQYLENQLNMSRGINLNPKYVPQTIYWLFIDERPVGIGKLRHYLNDNLRKSGGHIGYCIRPSEREKGYGKMLLKELLKKARDKGIEDLLLTCDEDNLSSRKVIEGNRGILDKIVEGQCKYWIYNK